MAKAKPKRAQLGAAPTGGPGRPRTSSLAPLEQARRRRERFRQRKRDAGMVAAEIWLPETWHAAILARGETLQNAAQRAFRLLIAQWEDEDSRTKPSQPDLNRL